MLSKFLDNKKNRSLIWLVTAFLISIILFRIVSSFGINTTNFHVSFTLGFLIILGHISGSIFSYFTFPQLSGFLFVGMLCGPSFLSLIGPSEIAVLAPLNDLALVLIAVQAGSEIPLAYLKKGAKSLFIVILCQVIAILLGVTAIFLVSVYFLGYNLAQNFPEVFSAAILFSTISISKAPADTLAILGESRLKGPFANHILGLVVIIDIVVIVLFQIVLLIVKPEIIQGAIFDVGKIIHLGKELISSTAAGFSLGIIFITWYAFFKNNIRQSILFLILASFGTSIMCNYLQYDVLIVFIVGGFIVGNFSSSGHYLIETVEAISHGVMIVFFATAGAMLNLEVLKILWPYALLLAFSRILFTAIGTYIGHILAKDNLKRFRYSFSAYISQAGVTLALAHTMTIQLGEFGKNLSALITAVVAINEIIGPVCFKLSIRREQKLFSD